MKKLIALFMLFTFATAVSYATETLNGTGTARAKIIQAATLTHETGALNFGTIIPGDSAGTVTLQAVESPTASDSVEIAGRVTADPVSSDHFTLANLDTATTYTISVPATATITSSTNNMTVDLTKSDTTVTGVASKVFYVGGTLHVGANQAVGSYEGNYTVTVTY